MNISMLLKMKNYNSQFDEMSYKEDTNNNKEDFDTYK